ncbi:hypothetical protein [Rhizobium leguminosarum]|nr:hypothetical protein [Rhizobium leguminosarum]WFT90664.1 hypothetical protein QA638_37280 [Rhizobium leguminosarum]
MATKFRLSSLIPAGSSQGFPFSPYQVDCWRGLRLPAPNAFFIKG